MYHEGSSNGFLTDEASSTQQLVAVGEVVALTGCRSDQTSADVADVATFGLVENAAGGALTSVLVEVLEAHGWPGPLAPWERPWLGCRAGGGLGDVLHFWSADVVFVLVFVVAAVCCCRHSFKEMKIDVGCESRESCFSDSDSRGPMPLTSCFFVFF